LSTTESRQPGLTGLKLPRDAQTVLTVHFWRGQGANEHGTRTLVAIPTDEKGNLTRLALLKENGDVDEPTDEGGKRVPEILGIYRIVFHRDGRDARQPQQEYLAVDVNPDSARGGEHSKLTISNRGTHSTAELSVYLLCAVNPLSKLQLTCEIDAVAGPAPTTIRFRYARLDLHTGYRTDTKSLLDGKTLVAAVTERSKYSLGLQDKESVPALKKPEALGIDIDYDANNASIVVSFLTLSALRPPSPRSGDSPDGGLLTFQFQRTIPAGGKASAINTFALRPETFAPEECDGNWIFTQRPWSTLSARPLPDADLARPPASSWLLCVDGAPAGAALRHWEEWRQPYHDAFPRIQGSSRLSLLPAVKPSSSSLRTLAIYRLLDRADEADSRRGWKWQAREAGDPGTDVLIIPTSLHICRVHGPDTFAEGSLPLVLTTTAAVPLQVRIPIQDRGISQVDPENARGVTIHTTGPLWCPAADDAHKPILDRAVRFGALDLIVSTATGNPSPGQLRLTPDTVECGHQLAIAEMMPGGQDRLMAPDRDEQDDIDTQRDAPLIIWTGTPAGSSATTSYILTITERVRPDQSQTVGLALSSVAPDQPGSGASTVGGPHKESVVVIDREPFLVAEVLYPHIESKADDASRVIATWQNFGPGAGAWQLRFEQEPFTLLLPPQGVGEQMVRAHGPTEQGADPMRFGLSPLARVELDPRQALTRFTEAPWNLRRILGTPGSPGAGPLVKRLDYELLYGLTCGANEPAIRLAELFSRLGRIPPLRPARLEWDADATREQLDAFEGSRQTWKRIVRRYRSRLATLEPWQGILLAGGQSSVVLKDGLSCQIRLPPNSSLKLPFDLPEVQQQGEIAGGATRAFESRNVLQATLFDPSASGPNPKPRHSDSAELSDFYLSSLGGWGRQMAGFQNNLTKIYGDVAMGRTYRYKVERIGRIGVFWNLAKHVVVYERAVVPSRQFAGATKDAPQQDHEQRALAGWPVLRKVSEFVEILEDCRQYPDRPGAVNTSEQAALKRARGFVAHLSFPPGARFNVLGTWGSDVADTGWKVPLWNPAATPQDVYPRPQVSLGVITGDADKGEIAPCDIAEPQQLVFYTQTKIFVRNAAGQVEPKDPPADPNEWAPVETIDYVNVPRLSPATDFTDGDARHYSANESAVLPGCAPCTFKLLPPAAPINVVADRTGQPLRALLDSVTMVRGLPTETTWDTVSGRALKDVAALETTLTAGCKKLLSELDPAQGAAAGQAALERIRGIAANGNPFKPLADQVTAAKQTLAGVARALPDKLQQFEKDACSRCKESLRRAYDIPLDEFEKELKALDTVFTGADLQRTELLARLMQLRAAGDDVLRLAEGLPGATTRFLDRYAELVLQFYRDLSDAVGQALRQIEVAVEQRPVNEVRDRLAVAFSIARSRIAAFGSLAGQRPIPWIPDPTGPVRAKLDVYVTGFQEKADKALQALATRDEQTRTQAAADIRKFRDDYLTPLTAEALAQYLDSIGLPVTSSFEAIRDELNKVEAWRETAATKWHAAVDAVAGAIPDAVNTQPIHDALATVRDWSDNSAADKTHLPDIIDNLCAKVMARLDKVANLLVSRFAKLEGLLNGAGDAFTALLGPVGTPLEKAEQKLRDQLDEYAGYAREYLDHAAGALLTGKTDVWNAADTAVRVVRAFGEPPQVPRLTFDRSKLGYYYDAIASKVDLTPVTSIVSQINEAQELGGRIQNALKPLGVSLPTLAALDQLLPSPLKGFDLSKIFPSFAGLNLEHLFTGLKLPDLSSDKVKITHGFDPQAKRGFVRADVDVPIAERATVFTFGPLSLQLPSARFTATTVVESDIQGHVTRRANGKIAGTWQLVIGSSALVEFLQADLLFDDGGSIRFNIDPQRINLPGVMGFLTDALGKFSGEKENGVSSGMTKDAFRCVLSLPIPDIQAGAFGISNLRLAAGLSLYFNPSFKIGVDFALARKEAPFALSIFILGGTGFVLASSIFKPDTHTLEGAIDVAIGVSASLSIALGPIKGGVYAGLTITVSYRSGTGVAFGVLFVLRGEVNVLGIVSACIVLMLEATYNPATKEMTGTGRLSISIKICWCFTLEVNEDISYTLGSPSNAGNTAAAIRRPEALLARANLDGTLERLPPIAAPDSFADRATAYVNLLW
jgi:hypothetical protein